MNWECKGICLSTYRNASTTKLQLWDIKGFKQCLNCDFILQTDNSYNEHDDIRCKCCNAKFRRRVRKTIRKNKT